ncbi:hypothetical protein [Actinocrispum sp. NPDC049592]|uniref:hypothetical protein n=1 Tax=Actinocrispum sp. NPDC049592 TaxID=3154835 RepID=UPI00344251B5
MAAAGIALERRRRLQHHVRRAADPLRAPWDAFDRIDAPGCVAHGKRVYVVGDLLHNLRSRDFDDMDTDLAQLADWLGRCHTLLPRLS